MMRGFFFYIALTSTQNFDPTNAVLQASKAGIVIVGIVNQQKFARSNVEGIELADVEYFKGIGPRRVSVRGFGSKRSGEVLLPFLGTRVIVFGCKSSDDDFPVQLNPGSWGLGISTYSDRLLPALLSASYKRKIPSAQQSSYYFEKCYTESASDKVYMRYGF